MVKKAPKTLINRQNSSKPSSKQNTLKLSNRQNSSKLSNRQNSSKLSNRQNSSKLSNKQDTLKLSSKQKARKANKKPAKKLRSSKLTKQSSLTTSHKQSSQALILSATIRQKALTLKLSYIVQKIYQDLGKKTDLLDLKQVPLKDISQKAYSSPPLSLKPYLNKIAKSKALIIVCPEYNGGMPGPIKHFIDHWIYPESFVYKPLCLIGLGGKFGAFNPINQLQSIFLYRHSFVFPLRVFVQNVSQVLKNNQLQDEHTNRLLIKQAENFIKFTQALDKQSFN